MDTIRLKSGSLLPVIFCLFIFSGCAVSPKKEIVIDNFHREEIVIENFHLVTIITPNGNFEVLAKIDTGARRSSISRELAEELGLEETGETVTVTSANGKQKRSLAKMIFSLEGYMIEAEVTLADRSMLEYPILIGSPDLVDRFLVRPQHFVENK
jgi:hypothetical protein